MWAAQSSDLVNWQDITSQLTPPPSFRHGTVREITLTTKSSGELRGLQMPSSQPKVETRLSLAGNENIVQQSKSFSVLGKKIPAPSGQALFILTNSTGE